MKIGQPHDKRQYRRLKKTDYYEAKAALEKPQVTSWPKCEVCGLECKGKTYAGDKPGRVKCQECMNETV